MRLSKAQQIISDSKKRFRSAACARRFGKSFLAMNEVAKFARLPNQNICIVAPTYRQVKQVFWNELKERLHAINWIQRVNESDLCITLINNSRIYLRSADNYDSLRGMKYNFIVMDECADINPEAWFSVLRPTLSDTQGDALFIGSPKGRNWFYDLWVNAKNSDEWESFQFTTLDGGQVPPEEIAQARLDLDARTFEQEYESQFVTWSQTVFYGFTDECVKKFPEQIPHNMPLHCGFDFNINPGTCTVSVLQGDDMYVIDEILIYSSNTLEMCQELRLRYPTNPVFAYPDASGAQRRTSAGGMTDHIILQNQGFKLRVNNTNPSVIDRINSTNARFTNSSGEHHLYVDPRCRQLREALIKHSYKENSRIPEKDKGYDHITDALSYSVYQLYPIGRNYTGSTNKRRTTGRML
jgi:hypothetical protein